MKTPKNERELHIGGYTYNADGKRSGTVEIYTSDYSYMTKFDKYCRQNPDEWHNTDVIRCDGDIVGKKYTVPLKCISFRSKTVYRTYSAEQRQAMADRMTRNIQSA